MEEHKLKIQIGTARAELKTVFENFHRPVQFDIAVQAELHCSRVAGITTPYDAQIDRLEELELQLEKLTNEITLPRWRARRACMRKLVESGTINGQKNINRAAAFLTLIDNHLAGNNRPAEPQPSDHEYIKNLLHPAILESSWPQFQAGQLRDAVFNAYVAIGDLIRSRTNLSQDGKPLVELALSVANPKLILSTLDSESGKSDQLGFMQIISGAFVGIRNPKAHSLEHDLDVQKTVHYLVLASLLAHRVAEAKKVNNEEA
ncbi:MAG TPA: TIGR02391 family protein [Candidatus Binatia bacterium]|nr:TIGR02391 family protein [Candidatus Binatia bacterium]